MIIQLTVASASYSIDTERPIDLSIPLQFNEEHQPRFYTQTAATSHLLQNVERLANKKPSCAQGCNVEEYTFIPHCHGTHTEGVGHITHQKIALPSLLQECFIPATLITVNAKKALDSSETYVPEKQEADWFITHQTLNRALSKSNPDFLKGLIVRTLPNDETKKSRDYAQCSPFFFSLEAMTYLVNGGIEHLLVDLPSIDRMNDEGKLTAHHIFWNVPPQSHEVKGMNPSRKTITEMIYVPDTVPDGPYLLNLQIPPFMTDAAPSRPLVYLPKSNEVP